jgi:hypothetical protein
MAKQETITSYHWSDAQSVIQRIDVREQSNGFAVAYLYANPDPALKETRLNIRAAIRHKGWGTLSDHRDDQFALRVSGLRSGDALISMLQNEGFVSLPTQQTTQAAQPAQAPTTLWQKIRSNSLKYSGMLATVGNIVGISRGVHNRQVAAQLNGSQAKQWGEIGKGLAFAASDLPLAIAGGNDDARQLTDFLTRLRHHYEKEGIEIPRTASIYVETSNQQKTFGELTMDYMHRYANQIKCSFEVVAALMSIKGGREQDLWPKRVAPFFWGTGFAASGLIQEKQIDPEKYEKAGTLERLWMKIQSNPLVLGGTLGWTNNAADYYSAKIGYKRWNDAGRKGTPLWMWDVATPTTMVGANGLYAISKKTVGGDIKSDGQIGDAYTVASQIINKQPEALREKAIESTARFFADRTEIKETYREALARLHKEVEVQRQNPWFEPQGLANYTPAPKPHKVLRAEQNTSSDALVASNAVSFAGQAQELPTSTITQAGLQHTRNAVSTEHSQASSTVTQLS